MKTPEEVKKGLECCIAAACMECPYYPRECDEGVMEKDAKSYIKQLEEQNAELVRKTEQLQSSMDQVQEALWDNGFGSLEELLQAYSQAKRERDALLEDLADHCGSKTLCKKYEDGTCPHGYDCTLYLSNCEDYEWRGVPEQEG